MLQDSSLTLAQTSPGETVLVKGVEGDGPIRSKLNSLGFTPGTPVYCCSGGCPKGCCRVVIRNSPLVLDEAAATAVVCAHCKR